MNNILRVKKKKSMMRMRKSMMKILINLTMRIGMEIKRRTKKIKEETSPTQKKIKEKICFLSSNAILLKNLRKATQKLKQQQLIKLNLISIKYVILSRTHPLVMRKMIVNQNKD